MNLPLEELNVTIILNSNTRTVQVAEFPEISHFLNQHHSSLARHFFCRFFFLKDIHLYIYLQLTPLTALIVYLHLHLQLRNKLTLHYSTKQNITYITIQSTIP